MPAATIIPSAFLADGPKLIIDTRIAGPLLQEEFTEQFNKLEDWEKTQILSSLQRVVSMMEAKHIEATPILATGPISATTEETKDFLENTIKNETSKTEKAVRKGSSC